jgi:hypothetical protein
MGKWNGEPALMTKRTALTKRDSKAINVAVLGFFKHINSTTAPLLAISFLEHLAQEGFRICTEKED